MSEKDEERGLVHMILESVLEDFSIEELGQASCLNELIFLTGLSERVLSEIILAALEIKQLRGNRVSGWKAQLEEQ